MVVPGVADDSVTTAAPLSAGVVAITGAAVDGGFDGDPCAETAPPQPAEMSMPAASTSMSWIRMKVDIEPIPAFGVQIYCRANRG